MKLSAGNLILSRGKYGFNKNEFSVSVVLDADSGNGCCHIRDIYNLRKGELNKTMNWSQLKFVDIIGVIDDISDIDYTQDFFDISNRLPIINAFMCNAIPEYLV